jgi:hypothetical protein
MSAIATRSDIEQREYLIETVDLTFGLLAVGLEGFLELPGAGLLNHAGQGFEDVLFGVVDVLEGFEEEIFHRLDRHGGFSGSARDWRQNATVVSRFRASESTSRLAHAGKRARCRSR